MPMFMLSFLKGQPIALALDKNNKTVFTIYVTEEKDLPDITVDNPSELIDEDDLHRLRQSMKLGTIELKLLKKAMRTSNQKRRPSDRSAREKLNLNSKLRAAMEVLDQLAIDKLKREISFEDDEEVDRIIPLIGEEEFDRSVFLQGPSGSGKTFLAKEIMKFDKKKRPCLIFSKIDDDASLRELDKLKSPIDGKSRLIKIKTDTESDLLELPNNESMKNCICLFDDLDSYPKDQAQFLREYRDSILECGRHHNITVLSTSHHMFNWAKTKTALNECQLACMFPNSNKKASMLFLRNNVGLDKHEIDRVIGKSMRAGRFMVCRMSAPNLIMHEKGVLLI